MLYGVCADRPREGYGQGPPSLSLGFLPETCGRETASPLPRELPAAAVFTELPPTPDVTGRSSKATVRADHGSTVTWTREGAGSSFPAPLRAALPGSSDSGERPFQTLSTAGNVRMVEPPISE